MGNAARPSDQKFTQVLQESLETWTFHYVPGAMMNTSPSKPLTRNLSSVRPHLFSVMALLPMTRQSGSLARRGINTGKDSLFVNGRSTWARSMGTCDLQPRVLPKQLLLEGSSQLSVELSDVSPLADWPRVQGLSGYEGNYLSVLYFAWAYILSARWVELLGRSADHV